MIRDDSNKQEVILVTGKNMKLNLKKLVEIRVVRK